MSIATANKNAFEAYNILYYPLLGKRGLLNVSDEVISKTEPRTEDWAYALTAQENLTGTSYALTDRALVYLAKLHAIMDEMFNISQNPAVASAMLIDPASDIRSFLPNINARPMYPDFPTQVMEMSEEDFRLDQLRHYLSTYGAMLVGELVGIDVKVGQGWLPEGQGHAKKTQAKTDGVPVHYVELALCSEDIEAVLDADFTRASRMNEPALKLAVEFAEDHGYVPAKIAFHENMMEFIRAASNKSSTFMGNLIVKLAQHPGDVFKSVLWTCDHNGQNHLSTKQKKAYCRALETFPEAMIARNIVDNGSAVRKVPQMLSVKRFAGPVLKKAVADVEERRVLSWNSEIEKMWEGYRADPSERNAKLLLGKYSQRPGVMLRALTRLVKSGIPEKDITETLGAVEDALSMTSLIGIQTSLTALDTSMARTWGGRLEDQREDERFEECRAEHAKVAKITLPILVSKMAKITTPMKNKKVWIDTCGFSMQGSLVLPNAISDTSMAYPPVGMAYDIPEDKVVRFFTFWDDREKNVDVDLHFFAMKSDGKEVSIGWNAEYSTDGMVTSGDITSSEDSAEYLDIDMQKALESGIDTVYHLAHIYSGCSDWKDISKCFSGALLIGDTKPDVELYNSKNILFHDDMNGIGRSMNYAFIDVPNHFVRILRGTKIPFRHNVFTLDIFVKALLRAQRAEIVENKEDAEMVLAIGRSNDEKAVSLIDNGFFIR